MKWLPNPQNTVIQDENVLDMSLDVKIEFTQVLAKYETRPRPDFQLMNREDVLGNHWVVKNNL